MLVIVALLAMWGMSVVGGRIAQRSNAASGAVD
jgi:hypothetical protein